MHFLSFLIRNLLRRKLRTLLTASAVAIAVGSVVSLVGISTGFLETFMKFYEGVGIDLLVTREGGATRRLTSSLPESLADKIKQVPGVKEVIPGSVDVIALTEYDLPVVPINGLVPETFIFDHYRMTSGRKLNRDDKASAMLGAVLAGAVGKKVGEKLELIPDEPYEIVGIFEADSPLDNNAVILPLKQMQYMTDREGLVTGVSIVLENPDDEAQIESVTQAVMQLEKGLSVRPTKEHVNSLIEIKTVIGMAWLTSAVAMVVGTLGMLNTMLMSLQERTGEIGLLRAVGWTRQRIARMILGESVLLSVLGGVLGVAGAMSLVYLLTRLPAASMVKPSINPVVIGQGMLVALVVGVLGGVLPALHATKLAPADALRQAH